MNFPPVRPVATLDVRVIGVGGAGCSSLSRLSDVLPGRTRFLGIDTGSGANGLRAFAGVIQTGDGFGSGGDPAVAENLFAGYHTDVSRFVAGADVVIIVAGLGRGTGSGVAPLVAQISKASGALTLAAVNMPFEFEGRVRSQSAIHALNRLCDFSDSVIVISNGQLLESARTTGSTSLVEAFSEANSKILNSLRVVIKALETSGSRFAQVQRSLRSSGKWVFLSGSSHGLHAGKAAVERAFAGMSRGVVGFSGLSGVKSTVIHVEGGIGLSAGQVAEAVAAVRARTGRIAELHVSSAREVTMGRQIRVTLILAGSGPMPELKSRPEPGKNGQFNSESGSIWPNGIRRPAAVSLVDTPWPVRRRGPMLLPVS